VIFQGFARLSEFSRKAVFGQSSLFLGWAVFRRLFMIRLC
jgi:hypothetical protein